VTFNDGGNALFEALGGVCIWINVHRLYHDKQVRGVSWLVSLFFASWGVWNLYYYPSLGQWWSFTAGLAICAGNFLWVALAVRYRKN
jgi:hypothetical protein